MDINLIRNKVNHNEYDLSEHAHRERQEEQRSLKVVSKCYFCKGKTEIKNIDIDFRWGNKLFVVKNAPVEVCSQCGERYYSAKIGKKLDELAKKQDSKEIKPQKTIEVPVFNWQ